MAEIPKVVIKTGFKEIKCDFLRDSTLREGKNLLESNHVFDIEESEGVIKGKVICQTSVNAAPYKVSIKIIMSNKENMVGNGYTILDFQEVCIKVEKDTEVDANDAEILQNNEEIADEAYSEDNASRIKNNKRNREEILDNNNLPPQSEGYQIKMEPVDSERDEEANNDDLDIDIHYNYEDIKKEYQSEGLESNVFKVNDTFESELIHNNQPLKIEECTGVGDWSHLHQSQPSEPSPIDGNLKAGRRRRRKMQIEIRDDEFCQLPPFDDSEQTLCEDDRPESDVEKINKNNRTVSDFNVKKKQKKKKNGIDSDMKKERNRKKADKREIVTENCDVATENCDVATAKCVVVFVCSICEKTFASEHLLNKHSNIHAPSNLCQICGKIFSHQHNMKTHMRVHTGERPYHCTLCDRKFPRRDHLTRHMDTHTGVRPFQCKVCEKTFRRSTHLNRHSKMHTGEKPYPCIVCNKRFVELRRLKKHMANRHKYL